MENVSRPQEPSKASDPGTILTKSDSHSTLPKAIDDIAHSSKDESTLVMGSEQLQVDADTEKGAGQEQPSMAPNNTDQAESDPNLVTWNGPSDPDNPKNWPFKTRWRMTAISSAFAFISPISTSMIAPALTTIGRDLHITHSFQTQLTLSAFILAYAVGPFLAAPLSETYGRRYVLQLFNLIYLAFNTACGFAKTGTQLIVCRFFAGFGGSAASVISVGILGDVWRHEERGMSISIYTSITLLSPTLGPVLGGFITQYSSWRWTFWSISIADTCVQVLGIIFFRETFAPTLLGRKTKALRIKTVNQALHTKWETANVTFTRRLLGALSRPVIMLATQPICQVIGVYTFYVFGLSYLALASFAELWTTCYHESVSISGLHYLALALGYTVGTQSCAQLIDRVYKRVQESRGGEKQPEYRLPLLLLGTVLVPGGLLWYGWSAERHYLWIMPDIGIAIFGIGVRFTTQCVQLYALDVYPTYTASASAQGQFVRALSGFTFPLFAPYLYESLGYGYGNTVLAMTALLLGLLSPFLLWHYGPALRHKSTYAVG